MACPSSPSSLAIDKYARISPENAAVHRSRSDASPRNTPASTASHISQPSSAPDRSHADSSAAVIGSRHFSTRRRSAATLIRARTTSRSRGSYPAHAGSTAAQRSATSAKTLRVGSYSATRPSISAKFPTRSAARPIRARTASFVAGPTAATTCTSVSIICSADTGSGTATLSSRLAIAFSLGTNSSRLALFFSLGANSGALC
mmetsp:Transcript_19181/g.48073  ORF Transcript_19181/g.48073 Transcript_19181/m.48073 type:complete len:203 (-) Transcript_19181:51-659(-)